MTRESKPSIGARLPLVEALALRNALDDVDHDDGARQLLLGDALGGRRADVAGADDRNLVDHECDSLKVSCCRTEK